MKRHPTNSYPWHKANNDDDNSISRLSIGSLSRSCSEDSSGTPGSPKAVDPEDLESKIVYCGATKASSFDDCEKGQKRLLNDELACKLVEDIPPSKKNKIEKRSPDSGPTPAAASPRTNRWWEAQASRITRWWEPHTDPTGPPRWWDRTRSESSRSLHSLVCPSVSTATPPPVPLRSSRNISLPGAFPVAGISGRNDRYREDEEFEDEPSPSTIDSRSLHDVDRSEQMEDTLLLEATLVSEKSSRRDFEQRSNELVFQAEPLQIKRIFTVKSICCLVCLLLFIAVIGIAAGTELGRRQYEAESVTSDEELSPRHTPFPFDRFTPAPVEPINDPPPPSTSSTRTPAPIMAAPPQEGEEPPTLAPSARPPRGSDYDGTDAPSFATAEINSRPKFLDQLPDKTKTSLDNPSSPQFLAYNWLVGDPHLKRFSTEQQLQRFALATLYYCAGGSAWERQKNWMSRDVDACEWQSDTLDGLRCREDANNNGWYEILDLNKSTLRGTLPDELWLLRTLVSLQLYGHGLQGSIPTIVGKMLHLESLRLFDNSLEGSIPKEIGLAKLMSLHLGGNALTGPLPNETGKIQKLRHLFVNDNRLTGTLPTGLGSLTDLEELALQNNSFVGSIPSHLGLATNLQLFYLADNELSGTIPSELDNLSNLWALILQSNFLQGSLPELSSLSKVQYLLLGSNKLTGTVPATAVAGWKSMTMLDFGNNYLSGTLPASIGQLSKLQYLDLFDNNFQGPIPAQIGKLQNAEQIMLEKNRLTGTVPATFGLLTNLERLWLHDNDLKGSMPDEICNLVETGSLQSLSVDCHKVACECCDCSMSMPQAFVNEEGNAATSRQGNDNNYSTTLWDEFVGWVTNLFD